MHKTVVLLLSFAPLLAWAEAPKAQGRPYERVTFRKALHEARDEAAALSKAEKYEEAASRIRKVTSDFTGVPLPERREVSSTAGEYALRASLAKSEKATELKQMLWSLLFTYGSDVERAAPDDARVARRLKSLRKADPEYLRVFGEDAVRLKVVPQGKVSGQDLKTFAEAAKASLAKLGKRADLREGVTVLTLEVPPIEFVQASGNMFLGDATFCIGKIKGKWEPRKGAPEAFDLGSRDVTVNKGCFPDDYRRAGARLASAIIHEWLKRQGASAMPASLRQ